MRSGACVARVRREPQSRACRSSMRVVVLLIASAMPRVIPRCCHQRMPESATSPRHRYAAMMLLRHASSILIPSPARYRDARQDAAHVTHVYAIVYRACQCAMF